MKLGVVSVLAALASTAAAAKNERTFAVLHFTGKTLTVGRADPIVNPGGPSVHLHHVLGGNAFSVNATGEDLAKSTCSSAQVKGDNSNYWFPSLYFRDPKTGKFEDVQLFYAQVYYFFEPTNDDIKAFPLGLSMVVGDASTRSPPAGGASGNLDPSKGPVSPVKWTCARHKYDPPSWSATSDGSQGGMPDKNNKGEGVGFPDANCDGYAAPLRMDIHFPSCYNPDAGLTDYKNNMAYPTNDGHGKHDCPKGWIHVPHIFFEVYWNTPLLADRWVPNQGKQPFVLSNGDATGYSLHGDFLSGWDEKLLQHIIDTCDTGGSGMEQCPGLFYGANKEKCTIPNPVPEKVSGVLDALPGNNPLSGWSYGDKPSTEPSSSAAPAQPSSASSSTSAAAPTSSATEITDPVPTKGPEDAECTPNLVTVWETVTVTAEAPDATPGSKARRHVLEHVRRQRKHD
ncbi:WSC domain-containingprotein [Purpureocillium lavendulum]|uniref:WSC domain-containingprotein n=1 Tax=Purpureocillium lavendulum TaxID=1247861 RepID=A0AB34G6L5_9HYPO|nr:WSC domain-containingprotein [Purpureocillium lavendulum]